jgi:ribonuclease BN (tRNA processing enzyme)
MELTIIGSAPASPNPGCASSCYLLDAGQGQVLLECGHGAAAKLLLYTSVDDIGAVVISHMHPDHFFDLVPLKYHIEKYAYPRLPLYLPPAGADILRALAGSLGENHDFWGAAYELRDFESGSRFDLLGLSIKTFPSHHFIPAWGMRIAEPDAGLLGYTSDTSLTEELAGHLAGVDLVLAESSLEKQTKSELHQGHLTGAEAGALARRVGAKTLVLTHYPQSGAEAIKREASTAFGQSCDLAVEGNRYTV